jgi:hypothetical protein
MFTIAVIILLASVITAGNVLRPPDRNARRYDVAAERVFEGTIVGKGYTFAGLLYVPFKTTDAVMDIQIGTEEFVARNNLRFRVGEMVTVMGVPIIVNERDVILAREISSMNGIVVLRDRDGAPLWEKTYRILMDPERRRHEGEVSQGF